MRRTRLSGKHVKNLSEHEDHPAHGFKRILVAIDGSENSMRAARIAVEMAQKYEAELVALHVIPAIRYAISVTTPSPTLPPGIYKEYETYEKSLGETLVGKVEGMASTAGVRAKAAVQEPHGSIVEGITDYAHGEHADLIVIGTRGLSGFKKLVIGSVSSAVVSHAHCPVLVVR